MKACPRCFASTTWVTNADFAGSSPAVCDFCKRYAPHTWPTTTWNDSLTRLFAIYEADDSPHGTNELHVQIQSDWRIFGFLDDSLVQSFLNSAFPDSHPLLDAGVRVRLRVGENAQGTDHLLSWAAFSEEIRHRNRYFPQTELDNSLLKDALLGSIESISEATPLYRARVLSSDERITHKEMGAPPANKAQAGRANPVGIPYLYLSYELQTSIYETRVANHTHVAIGTFRTRRELKVLNLADIEIPDFFSADDPITTISYYRYLYKLGEELKTPVRRSDQPIDYIPTQYLCELAKSLGLDGVLYPSSLDPAGRNVVLFDVDAAQCDTSLQIAEITSLTATWTMLAPRGGPSG